MVVAGSLKIGACGKLAPEDLNPDQQIQSLSCYHYTRGQVLLFQLIVAAFGVNRLSDRGDGRR